MCAVCGGVRSFRFQHTKHTPTAAAHAAQHTQQQPRAAAAAGERSSTTSLTTNSKIWSKVTNSGENRLRAKERFVEAIKYIDIISIIDKKRWQWLGHALRMEPHRNLETP